MVRLARIERATTGLEGRCSIQLSYRRNPINQCSYQVQKSRAVFLMPVLHAGHMNKSADNALPNLTKTVAEAQYSNLIRHVPSGAYYARLRVKGKLIRRRLKTDMLSVARKLFSARASSGLIFLNVRQFPKSGFHPGAASASARAIPPCRRRTRSARWPRPAHPSTAPATRAKPVFVPA